MFVPANKIAGALLVITATAQSSAVVAEPRLTLVALQPEFSETIRSGGHVMEGGFVLAMRLNVVCTLIAESVAFRSQKKKSMGYTCPSTSPKAIRFVPVTEPNADECTPPSSMTSLPPTKTQRSSSPKQLKKFER